MGQHQAQIFFHMYIEGKMQSGNDSFLDFKKRKRAFTFPTLYIHSCILAKRNFINHLLNIHAVGFGKLF